MGLFSRKEKAPKTAAGSKPALDISKSAAVGFVPSSHRLSPTNSSNNTTNTNGTQQTPQTISINLHTPLTPCSPYLTPPSPFVQIPKMDLPKPPDPRLDPAGYLRSLPAVRERSRIVTDKALQNSLTHFDVDMQKFPDVVTFVAGIIKLGCST